MEKKLEKLMKENPELPLVFSCSSDELEEGYYYYKNYKNLNYKLKNVKNASAEGKIYFTSQEIKKVMIDNILPYL